ncbi:MAG TPA: hypothetical protein VK681_30905, partial [Reyranella sp.]|nr:hypothetical protein [Reyranella sp.]
AAEISREEVRREALSQRVNAAGADEVILALEQAGVLREVDDDEEYPGRGRPARRWQVNPALRAKPAAQIAEKKTSPESEALSAHAVEEEEGDPRLPVPSAAEERGEGEVAYQAAAPPGVPAPVQVDWPK